MNLKTISEVFCVTPCGNGYTLSTTDNNKDEIYPDYHGSTRNPFVGYIERKGSVFQFVSYGLDLKPYSRVRFDTIEELKQLVSTYLMYFRNNGLNSDCCDPQFVDAYKCECAFYQFFKNNTNLTFNANNNNVKFRDITISSRHKIPSSSEHNEFEVVLSYDNGGFSIKKCTTPHNVIMYLKSFMEVFLLCDISESIGNLRKMSGSEIDNNYTFDGDMLYKVDLRTLSIQQIGALKDDMIKKLEEKINLLKNE